MATDPNKAALLEQVTIDATIRPTAPSNENRDARIAALEVVTEDHETRIAALEV